MTGCRVPGLDLSEPEGEGGERVYRAARRVGSRWSQCQREGGGEGEGEQVGGRRGVKEVA